MTPAQLQEVEAFLDDYKGLLADELFETAAGCRVAFLQYLDSQLPPRLVEVPAPVAPKAPLDNTQRCGGGK